MISLVDHPFQMLLRHMSSEEQDFPLYPEPAMYSPPYSYNGLQNISSEPSSAYTFARSQESYPTTTGFNSSTMYAENPVFSLESPELRSANSNYSTASGPSAASSTMGSPHSLPGRVPGPEWASNGLGLTPSIVQYDNSFGQGSDYSFTTDPSILHPQYPIPRDSTTQGTDAPLYQATMYPASPALSPVSSRSPRPQTGSQSPFLGSSYASYACPPPMNRRPSNAVSHYSYNSHDGNFSSDESKEKGRCTYPECGKVFKDLKAHMLTHQTERPEKCPIQTCDYYIKGFARKYDKNRHTLTHYKGTMVCGFCPGSGSAAEKSFNRADVFKRHLTSVHAVEQTPPNSRKKTSNTISRGKKLSGYAPDATGKCSTCSATFGNAQDFYEHLDDCVLRIVQQEEPSEAINAARLAEVEQDSEVHETLRNNALPVTTIKSSSTDEEDEEEVDDENDDDFSLRSKSSRKGRGNRNPANGVQKSRGMTHSKGGVTLNTKGRKKRKDYPSSWGCQPAQMKMRKRVLAVFDGPRRLWKDDMMLDTDYEVRMKIGDDKAYVTDLDVQTLRRADAFHEATEEEKGPWIADDLTGMDLEKLMEVKPEL